jgi:hypothetical protein
VRLWYEAKFDKTLVPYPSSVDAIKTFPTTDSDRRGAWTTWDICHRVKRSRYAEPRLSPRRSAETSRYRQRVGGLHFRFAPDMSRWSGAGFSLDARDRQRLDRDGRL